MPTAPAIPSTILPTAWFTRPTCVVAADLIGKILCRQFTDTDGSVKVLRMRISETEAYIGESDGSVQAHIKRSKQKSALMYREGGIFYVYLTYGVHHMLNVVSGLAESPEAVLIRAGFWTEDSERLGDDLSAEQLLSHDRPQNYLKPLAGPGKLTKRLQIDRDLYGKPISPVSGLWIEDDGCTPPVSLRPRIGIDYAGAAKDWLLRYIWTEHPSLSKK